MPPQPDPERGTGEHDQTPRGDFSPPDGSESLFSMYLDRAIEEDRRMVESWKEHANGMLTSTGLFSAAVAALLVVSIPDIRPNSQDTSAFYLAHIYQQSSTQPNGSRPSIPSSLSDPTEPFSPPKLSVWVNGLWFSSLVINLSCALLATLLQQWARRYEKVANPRYRPHKRARIRAFYRDGVERWGIPEAVEALPVLLHISIFLFFAGISVFLFGVHRTIFKAVTTLISLIVISYTCLALSPVFHMNCLYFTPLSIPFSFCLTATRFLFFRILPGFNRKQLPFSQSMVKAAEKYALELEPDIDHDSLLWTFESLDNDTDFEEFFDALPLLCDSDRDTGEKLELKEKFIEPNKSELSNALMRLMDRTLSSNLVEESVKYRRMVIFIKAMDSKSTSLLDRSHILRRVFFLDVWDRLVGYMEFGLSMRIWADNLDKVTVTSFYAQCVAALTISESLKRDRHGWIQLVKNMSTPIHPHVIHEHDVDEHDEDILLANAIFVVRMAVQTYAGSEENEWDDILKVSRKTLGAVCKLDRIQDTLPELRHEFCDLWNKLVTAAQTDELPHHRTIAIKMLRNIRKLYIALHPTGSSTPPTTFYTTEDWEQILDNSELYRKCTKEDHCPPSSFPGLEFNALPTQRVPLTQPTQPVPPAQPVVPAQPVPPTQSMVYTQPVPLTQPVVSTQPVPPTQPMVSTQPVPPIQPAAPRFPELHTLTHHNTLSSLGQPPSPGFPDENRYRNVQQPPSPGKFVLPEV